MNTAYVIGYVSLRDGQKQPVYVSESVWAGRKMVRFTSKQEDALALPLAEATEFAASLARDGEGYCSDVANANGVVTGFCIQSKG